MREIVFMWAAAAFGAAVGFFVGRGFKRSDEDWADPAIGGVDWQSSRDEYIRRKAPGAGSEPEEVPSPVAEVNAAVQRNDWIRKEVDYQHSLECGPGVEWDEERRAKAIRTATMRADRMWPSSPIDVLPGAPSPATLAMLNAMERARDDQDQITGVRSGSPSIEVSNVRRSPDGLTMSWEETPRGPKPTVLETMDDWQAAREDEQRPDWPKFLGPDARADVHADDTAAFDKAEVSDFMHREAVIARRLGNHAGAEWSTTPVSEFAPHHDSDRVFDRVENLPNGGLRFTNAPGKQSSTKRTFAGHEMTADERARAYGTDDPTEQARLETADLRARSELPPSY